MNSEAKRKQERLEGTLRNMTTDEIVRYADSQIQLSVLEYELLARLSTYTHADIRRVRR